MKNILDFLTVLKDNNNKDWFHANRKDYDEAKSDFEGFINKLIPAISEFDKSIKFITAKECIFRINKDIRFSKDKSPYKTNFGAFISQGGRKSKYGGYYFHIEPSSSMIAGGVYMPEPVDLKAIRNEIYYNTSEFKKIIKDKNFIKYFSELDGDKLVNAPKDFPKDFPEIDLLKFKHYVVMHSISDKEILNKNLFDLTIEIFKGMYKFNEFLNKSLNI